MNTRLGNRLMQMHWWAKFPVVIAAVLVCACTLGSAGETVTDARRGFTLTLPEGFAPNPDLVRATPNIAHAFVLGDLTDDQVDIFLLVEELGGVIGRERLTLEQMPPGFRGRLFITTWQGFELDAFEVPERLGESEFITYNVQVPLKHAAIQLKLFGPVKRQAELDRLLGEILGGLHGESNWIPSAVPDSSRTSSETYGVVLVALAIVFILVGLVVLFFISKKTPKGTILAIAIAIYIVSWAFEGVKLREVMVLAGSMRLLGFVGGVLGIVDVLRTRKHQASVASSSAPETK